MAFIKNRRPEMSSKNISIAQDKREILVNGYATSELTREQMARWANNLTFVSYYTYGFNARGELIPITNEDTLIQIAYDSGVTPLMVLTPIDENGNYSYDLVKVIFWDPVIRDRLINNIFLTVTEKDYVGVVFNFGYIAPQDSEEFVITVSKTRARLNARAYMVVVSVTPGVNDAGINYESLGRAANFLELRTFYWEQAYGAPEAVSPIDKTREMLAYMITIVAPQWILLGLSNYGYDWRVPYVQGAAAELISHDEAEKRAIDIGAALQYDEAAQAPYYSYINPTGSHHVVWYEDARSIRAKLELVDEFNLAGVSIWTIMNPFPAGIAAIEELFTIFKV